MNIGIIVRTLQIGGMERVAANLADAFQKEGHNVTLMYLKNKPVEILPEQKNTDIRLINLDKILLMTGIGIVWILLSRLLNALIRKSLFVWLGLVQSMLFARELKKIEHEKGRFDLLIVRGQGTFELIWALKDERVVQVCENIFSKENPNCLDSFYSRLLFNGKNVVCVSNGVLENFLLYQKKTGIKPLTAKMITNPIDTEIIKERLTEKPEAISDKPYILGLGRFVQQKNFPLLIKAFKILIEKYNVAQELVLIGDGKQKTVLVELVQKMNLSSRVIFPGATDNPYAWMARADLFVLSSNFEGLGMVILEAFASGINVVATNSPGGVYDIMSNGSLTDQLSLMTPEDLAKIIYKTLDKPLPVDDISSVLKKFQPEMIANQYIEFVHGN